MAEFIYVLDDDTDYVNLDHVTRMCRTRDGEFLLLKSVDGTTLGKIGAELPTGKVIPAAPGHVATVIWIYGEEGRPTESDLSLSSGAPSSPGESSAKAEWIMLVRLSPATDRLTNPS
jgi:hypothetical protein